MNAEYSGGGDIDTHKMLNLIFSEIKERRNENENLRLKLEYDKRLRGNIYLQS